MCSSHWKSSFNSKRTSQAISPAATLSANTIVAFRFQFQADFPSHFTLKKSDVLREQGQGFNSKRTSQAISPPQTSQGVPRRSNVSIPSGLPKPFHPGAELLPVISVYCFNSKRTSQAISPRELAPLDLLDHQFQFQADFPSHFTHGTRKRLQGYLKVSIPSGLPKPFHR